MACISLSKKKPKVFYIVNLCTGDIKEFVAERKAQGHFFCLLHLEFQRLMVIVKRKGNTYDIQGKLDKTPLWCS